MPPLERSADCRDFHLRKVTKRVEDANRLGTPLFFSEFGACGNDQECFNEITNSCDAFDETSTSWAYWQYKGFGDFTTISTEKQGMYDP